MIFSIIRTLFVYSWLKIGILVVYWRLNKIGLRNKSYQKIRERILSIYLTSRHIQGTIITAALFPVNAMKLTPPKIRSYKQDGRKIVMLTAYDYPGAKLLDEAGTDIILVGDSLGNVVQGKATTLPVTLDEIIYHAEMAARAVTHALVAVDLPFPYCQLGPDEAVRAGARILKETLADAVKFEGGENRSATIAALTDAGIPVLGHCGLRPQDIRQKGSYQVQRQRESLFKDIEAVEKAGAFAIVLECLESELAKEATQVLSVPTIGIGAGPHTDGQVLVFHDVLGYRAEGTRIPKHVKQYADLQTVITDAVKQYAAEVRSGIFPAKENSF